MDEVTRASRLHAIGEITNVIQYKPGWYIYVGSMGDGHYIQWHFLARCIKTGRMEMQHARKWYISRFATDSEIILTAFAAVKMAETHEIHETFRYDGVALFNPHHSMNALYAAIDSGQIPEDARQHLDT